MTRYLRAACLSTGADLSGLTWGDAVDLTRGLVMAGRWPPLEAWTAGPRQAEEDKGPMAFLGGAF